MLFRSAALLPAVLQCIQGRIGGSGHVLGARPVVDAKNAAFLVDVYKRQASVTAGLRKKEAMNLALPSGSSPPEKPPGSITIWPVSYTHLDVYKRQSSARASARWSALPVSTCWRVP